MSYVLSKKTVSTAKGVGVSSEKYPKLHLVDVMSDTWYPIPPRMMTHIFLHLYILIRFLPLLLDLPFLLLLLTLKSRSSKGGRRTPRFSSMLDFRYSLTDATSTTEECLQPWPGYKMNYKAVTTDPSTGYKQRSLFHTLV